MSALISPCGQYRYSLTRRVRDAERRSKVMFIGVNPSTADANTDDATIRKMKGFAHRWGYTDIMVGNVFAFRATDVRRLRFAVSPVGPHNEFHLKDMMNDADLIVPCWGSFNKVPRNLWHNFGRVARMVERHRPIVRVLGTTRWNDPRHPLMLGYSTPLVSWEHSYEP